MQFLPVPLVSGKCKWCVWEDFITRDHARVRDTTTVSIWQPYIVDYDYGGIYIMCATEHTL